MSKKLNYNNLAQLTNFRCGSNTLNLSEVFIQTANIPGISFSHIRSGGRSGTNLHVQADSIEYSPINVQLLMDDDFEVLKEITKYVRKIINPESGSFSLTNLDFWIEVLSLKGDYLFKIEFKNAFLESVDDIQFSTLDDNTINTVSLTICYDYYEIV